MGICRISANITTKYHSWMLLSKKCALKMFFYYITSICSGYHSCRVVQVADFKDIVMFSIKTCSIIEQTVFIEQNQYQQTRKMECY